VIKARAYEVTGQEGSPKVTSHAPDSAKNCEGMNPHILNLQKAIVGVNTHWIEKFFISLKSY
jgi:hypothetical protein